MKATSNVIAICSWHNVIPSSDGWMAPVTEISVHIIEPCFFCVAKNFVFFQTPQRHKAYSAKQLGGWRLDPLWVLDLRSLPECMNFGISKTITCEKIKQK